MDWIVFVINTNIVSHFQPSLHLHEHLAQVKTAADYLLAAHSSHTRTHRLQTEAVLAAIVAGHDIGKGSPAFQSYIRDPTKYRGDAHAKEHSALSAAIMLLYAKTQGWEALPALALTQIIASHHAGFYTLFDLENRLRLDEDDALITQFAALDRTNLAQICDLHLAGTEGEFEDARRFLFRRLQIEKHLFTLSLPEAVKFRLWTQFLFSLLLEADKAFLAISADTIPHYLKSVPSNLTPQLIEKRLVGLPDTPLNSLRQQLRQQILTQTIQKNSCYTLTLPTGTGKTLLAASWCLVQREFIKTNGPPRIIIALPFLSIIDQTEQEYRKLLELNPDNSNQSAQLLTSHSLSQREYELEGKNLGKDATFFLDTWRSEIIITTFDQLLLALLSPETRHQMRFHSVMDALIVLDEVQTIPCKLWNLIDQVLRGLTIESQTRILLMSATQPALLTDAYELAGNALQVKEIFSQFKRYQLHFYHRPVQKLSVFMDELLPRLINWCNDGKKVLITLNTRACAKTILQMVQKQLPNIPVWLISASVTPQDRVSKLYAIKLLRDHEAGIVISTQTIEAGIDIDMDIVIRDFAPLDSIIQIAGRCNRHNRLGVYGGQVEIVSLVNEHGHDYAGMIYDSVLLNATREVLSQQDVVGENAVLELGQCYFTLIKQRKDTGAKLVQDFARWEEMPNVQTLLRGERVKQISFLILNDNEEWLYIKIHTALQIAERWERREALRKLAGAIQQRTVSVYARTDLHPEDYAKSLGLFWILRSEFYNADSGLDLKLHNEEVVCIF